MLSLPLSCQLPLLMLVTMRGDHGEFNPSQVPMGDATQKVLEALGVIVKRRGQVDRAMESSLRLGRSALDSMLKDLANKADAMALP